MTPTVKGHLFAFITISIWSSTFIVSKILLGQLTPLQILIARFILAIIFLSILSPRFVKARSLREELLFLCTGTALALYFVFENSALKYTYSSNVSLIVATIPLITGLLSVFIEKTRFFNTKSILGFVIAYSGVWVIMANSQKFTGVNPFGDFLALGAAVMFAIYSLVMHRVAQGYTAIQLTRKVFLYGLAALAVVALVQNQPLLPKTIDWRVLVSLLFLGIVASSCAFILWNNAIKQIGSVKTNQYIYLIPVMTTVMSAILLSEKISALTILGTALILAGLVLTEKSQASHIQGESQNQPESKIQTESQNQSESKIQAESQNPSEL